MLVIVHQAFGPCIVHFWIRYISGTVLFLYIFFVLFCFFGGVGSSFLCEGFLQLWQVGGSLFIAVNGPLTIAASLVAEHRLQMRRLSSCGSRAQLLHGMWDPPRSGLESVSPTLAGRFPTTAPPGKLLAQFYSHIKEK